MAGTKTVLRYDAGTLRAPTITAQGFLRLDGHVGRPGIYEYRNTAEDEADGLGKKGEIRRELRPDDEVFRADVLDGFAGAPVTLLHPKKNVDPSNVRSLGMGEVQGSARQDGGLVAASMLVKDANAIKQVQSKKLTELSPGYRMRIDRTSGVDPKYGKYDVVQRDIVINHLALVPAARGGSDMRVRLDGRDDGLETRGDSMWFGDSFVDAAPGAIKLTSITEGHQHTYAATAGQATGCTSYAIADGADSGHEHQWVRDAMGKITFSENAGHTHAVIADTAIPAGARADAKPSTSTPRVESTRTDAADPRRGALLMDPEEQIRSLKAQLAESEKTAVERKDAIDTQTARADKAEATVTALEGRVSELTTIIDAGSVAAETEAIRLQAERADAAEATIAQFEKNLADAVTKRTSIIRKATAVMGDEFDPDAMSNRQIHAVVVRRLDAKADITDSVTDASLEGSFDALVSLRGKAARSLTRAASVLTTGANAGTQADRADSAQERGSAWRNQGREPLTGASRQKGA